MRGIILILLILSFCSCNRFWNRVIDGEVYRDVYMDDDRKVVVITYVEDSLSKIKVKREGLVNRELSRMKFLMEYSTSNGENLLENDLEYYSVKGANSDKSTIGRVKEDEKKDEENDDSSENAEDIVHLPDLVVKYETLKKVLEKQGLELKKKSQTD